MAKTCLDSFLDLNTRSSGGGGDAEIKRSRVRSLLVDVQQRYPKVWSKIFEELKAETQEGSDEEDDGDEHDDIPRRKEDVDRVLVLLSSVSSIVNKGALVVNVIAPMTRTFKFLRYLLKIWKMTWME